MSLKSFLFENKTAKQTVAKNTVWLTISNFGGRFLKAVVVIYGARVLGTAEWGIFSYAVTLAGFLTLFMDPGLNAILVRDSSKSNEEERRVLFSTTFVLKVCLLVLGVFFISFVGPYFSTLPGATALLPIVALILALDIFRDFFMSLIRSLEKMEWETGIFLLTNAAIVTFSFMFLFRNTTAISFGWGYVLGDAVGTVFAIFVLRKYFRRLFSYFAPSRILPILNSAWPFAVTGILGLLLTNTDILIISWMRSASDVGIFSAAIRIIQVLYLVPMIIQFSTLPALSRLAGQDSERFRNALEKTVGLIFLASVPMAVGGAILGTEIMRLVFGEAYVTGASAFKLLMLTMIFDYPATIISTAIFAHNRQRSLIVVSTIGAAANVTFDLLLIPRFGITGAAFGTLLTQILVNWYLWSVMKKINYFSVLPHLKKVALAGIIMGVAAIALLATYINVLLIIALCVVVYFATLYSMREPLLVEVKTIFRGGAPQTEAS